MEQQHQQQEQEQCNYHDVPSTKSNEQQQEEQEQHNYHDIPLTKSNEQQQHHQCSGDMNKDATKQEQEEETTRDARDLEHEDRIECFKGAYKKKHFLDEDKTKET